MFYSSSQLADISHDENGTSKDEETFESAVTGVVDQSKTLRKKGALLLSLKLLGAFDETTKKPFSKIQLKNSTLSTLSMEIATERAKTLIVLEGIINTSQTKNHVGFVEQLKMDNFGQFFDSIKSIPTISLLNNSIHIRVSYMLHCALSEEDRLVSYLFNDLGITSLILDVLKSIPEEGSNVSVFGARAFFYRLSERIAIAKEQSQNIARITKRISDLTDNNALINFADGALMDYLLGVNKLEPTMKVVVRSSTSSMIETLEKPDSNKPDMIFEHYRAEMQKFKEDKK
uniref:Uncharacterized protein n=1 Tax=Panagrolaimus sp. ES5 TaxID=591445 RepID=A0AC34F7Z8_9BILA